MTYKELALIALGMQTEVPDRIEEDFDIQDTMTETEMGEMIQIVADSQFSLQLQNILSRRLYEKVIENAVETLGADSKKFEFWCNATDTRLTYNGSHVKNMNELKLEVWREMAERKKRKGGPNE